MKYLQDLIETSQFAPLLLHAIQNVQQELTIYKLQNQRLFFGVLEHTYPLPAHHRTFFS